MNYLKKILSVNLVVIISFLFCSCFTKNSINDNVIYKDDSFNYNQLMNGGVAIGGVASKQTNFSNGERNQYNSHLSAIMIKELKDVRVINTLQLMSRISTEYYFSKIKEYDAEQMLSNEDMRAINESIPEIEYIIFACIENEYIKKETSTVSTTDTEKIYKTVYKTTLSLTVAFQIYDLSREQMVWNNIMYNEGVKTKDRTEDNFLGSIIGDIVSDKYASVDREDVLEEIYEELAEGLAEIRN